ncbi:heterokaryon incompatibility protein-domain-containing protein [Lophiotrema nucula]|uniref:Heterokaryon incompatibility protein-domain-containing protein n=1 Tax=Lophiotrema nucula TaxID=690887 RepID=A0A6A5Z2G6_9PLEO|nr:heterokaryon incompatibility protein-domain-containing protein [Lophiotrema nucula]
MDIYHRSPSLQSGSIRLLKVEPASTQHGTVRCNLEVVELATKPAYCALSYTWGSPWPVGKSPAQHSNSPAIIDAKGTPTYNANQQLQAIDSTVNGSKETTRCLINCNDANVWVTQNLFHFLSHCSRTAAARFRGYIWVDALCINQRDLDERSHQITMMADIYREASEVLVWLGVDDVHTSQGIELLRDIACLTPAKRFLLLPESVQSHERWIALGHFFQRSWFNRAWIIQEVHLYFYMGSSLQNLAARLGATKRSSISSSGDNLLHALIRSRLSACQDPRDKVYSQLQLGNADIFPTYNASIQEVFTATAVWILEHSDNLFVLCCVEGEDFQRTPELPSWVPDWSVTESLGLRITGYPQFSAGLGRTRKLEIINEDGRHILRVEGAEIDRVGEVYATKDEIRDDLLLAQTWSLFQDLDLASAEVLWRTIVTNRSSEAGNPRTQYFYPASSKLQESFHHWILWRAGESFKHKNPETKMELLSNITVHSKDDSILPSDTEIRNMLEKCIEDPQYHDKLYSSASLFDVHYTHAMFLRPFKTKQGYFGVGTQCLQHGDSIFIVSGCRVPLLFKSVDASSHYRLVGGSYVHGVMDGQSLENEKLHFQMLSLK